MITSVNLLLVYYKTGCKGLDVSVFCEVVLFICTACKIWLALFFHFHRFSRGGRSWSRPWPWGTPRTHTDHLRTTRLVCDNTASMWRSLHYCLQRMRVCVRVQSSLLSLWLQSTVLDQSHPVTPTAPAAPLYSMCISANHGAVSSIPGGNHLTMHSLDFCFLIPLTSTSILNLMTSEPAQSHRLWIQHWFSCDSAFLSLNHPFLLFTHNFNVINVWFGWVIDDFSNVVHLLYQIFSWVLIKKIILYVYQCWKSVEPQ